MAGRPKGWAYEAVELKGKRILLTGGTTGIGRATGRLLASLGADILTYGRGEQELKEALKDIKAVAKGKVVGVTADQSKPKEIARVFAEFDRQIGALDILINNAAQPAESVTDMPVEKIAYVVQSNLLAYMLTCKHAVERMKTTGGQIVNVGSLSAEVKDTGGDVYVATKSGIRGFSASLRKLVAAKKIRVSLLELGMVGTNLHGEPAKADHQREQIAQGQMLAAEDIAEWIYYCLIQPQRCAPLMLQIAPTGQAL